MGNLFARVYHSRVNVCSSMHATTISICNFLHLNEWKSSFEKWNSTTLNMIFFAFCMCLWCVLFGRLFGFFSAWNEFDFFFCILPLKYRWYRWIKYRAMENGLLPPSPLPPMNVVTQCNQSVQPLTVCWLKNRCMGKSICIVLYQPTTSQYTHTHTKISKQTDKNRGKNEINVPALFIRDDYMCVCVSFSFSEHTICHCFVAAQARAPYIEHIHIYGNVCI